MKPIDIESPKVKDDSATTKTDVATTKKLESSPPSIKRLFQTVKAEQPMLCVGVLLLFAAESSTQVIPLIVAKAYDSIISPTLDSDTKMEDVNYYMTVSVLIFIAGSLAGFVRYSIFAIVAERMVARMRIELYSSILDQEIAFFDENKSGELISRLGSDTTLLQVVMSQSLPEAVVNIVKAIVSICLIFVISPAAGSHEPIPPRSRGEYRQGDREHLFDIRDITGIGGSERGHHFLHLSVCHAAREETGEIEQSVSGCAGGGTDPFHGGAGGHADRAELHRGIERENPVWDFIGDPDAYPYWYPSKKRGYNPKKPSTYSVGFWKSIIGSGFFSIIFGGGFGFLYVCLWFGFYLVNNGDMTLGELTAFQSYVFNIGLGLGAASTNVTKILEGLGASGRIFYLLDRIPTISNVTEPPLKRGEVVAECDHAHHPVSQAKRDLLAKEKRVVLRPDTVEGRIQFNGVQFEYPSRPDVSVLCDYNLSITAGTTTALVGSSGSGKSTVVALLQRFYDISKGTITLDDRNICDLDVQWLRQQIGYVQQEPSLFGLSVRENLLYGVPNPEDMTTEKMEQACKDANCHDFIVSWPEGYDTLVGERGVKLSGGQKQRISIARALITDCRLLLLDEATSALDAESEHLVQEAIDRAVVGRTTIIVAHRLSTIQRADQIVVMSNHRIVDVGTHEELLERCKKYQALIARQQSNLSHSGSH
eukprot:CAMPEP_0194397898 /NCGR_PEP_ID=MMETSP0174-20130528/125801_1 /TAXON_ID=216777 /ORGANISM="Proboscia alata, Strain PI-D3" /LENGTH=706 /DNA_ID=CAMNT_0039194129 /DNA_START=40 /DNA_END=2158 /DNA_ORIENTATION=-